MTVLVRVDGALGDWGTMKAIDVNPLAALNPGAAQAEPFPRPLPLITRCWPVPCFLEIRKHFTAWEWAWKEAHPNLVEDVAG